MDSAGKTHTEPNTESRGKWGTWEAEHWRGGRTDADRLWNKKDAKFLVNENQQPRLNSAVRGPESAVELSHLLFSRNIINVLMLSFVCQRRNGAELFSPVRPWDLIKLRCNCIITQLIIVTRLAAVHNLKHTFWKNNTYPSQYFSTWCWHFKWMRQSKFNSKSLTASSHVCVCVCVCV